MEKMPINPLFITVTTEKRTRIDTFLSQELSSFSRSFFTRLIDQQGITLNGNVVTKQSVQVQMGDHIQITFPTHEKQPISTLSLPISIVYEHEHFFIINKPAGMLVHAAASSRVQETTVVDWILQQSPTMSSVGYAYRPGIVHRLDRDTSGLLIIARTNFAHMQFTTLFKNRMVHKTYKAVVYGHPDKEGKIDLPIGRHPVHKHKMTALNDTQALHHPARTATSHFTVEHYFDTCSLITVHPVTGRTHQIRVHMAAIGHPLVGDAVYGTKKTMVEKLISRHALHAYQLSFTFDGKQYQFTQEYPQDFHQLINHIPLAKG